MADYVPAGYSSKLLLGLAQFLTAAGFGVYREDSMYAPGERGIHINFTPALASTTPQESLSLQIYLPQRGVLATEHTSVQLRWQFVDRHPLYVNDTIDAVRALFPERPEGGYQEIGGLKFDRIYQRSATTWGEEDRPGVLNATQNLSFRGNRYE
ncbi:hypothetical protein [Pseudomonas sp.]|uniref:hypothetical protein n=1 Tax=Pseudomonas sp. TaxID=306 RepID=UPI00263685BD|nr:hypothetical protein [Pseudomonas sp.]